MNSFFYKSKGAISIFLLIILVPMMTLGAVLIDGTRKMSADQIVQGATDSAAMSVLADFDSVLKSEFGLFALENSENVTSDFENYFKKSLMASYSDDPAYTEMAWQYVKSMMLNKDNLANMNFYNFYDFQIENADVTPMYSLANLEVLENQIVEYMKYRAPVEMVKTADILAVFEQAQQLQEVNASMDLLKKKNKFDKKCAKVQQVVMELLYELENANVITHDFLENAKDVCFGYMYNISHYDTMADEAEDDEDRAHYKDLLKIERENFKKYLDSHYKSLGYVKDSCSKVVDGGVLSKGLAEQVIDETKKLIEEAKKLKKEVEPEAKKDGMVGETATQMIVEIQAVIDLSGYEEQILAKKTQAENKKSYIETYESAFKKFMDNKPNTVNKNTVFYDEYDDQGNLTQKGLYTIYDESVQPTHYNAGYKIDTTFPEGLRFATTGASGESEDKLNNYLSSNSPNSESSQRELNGGNKEENEKLDDALWKVLPTNSIDELKNTEPDFNALNIADKEYTDSIVSSLTNDIMQSAPSADVLSQLSGISFNEKEKGFFGKAWESIKNFFSNTEQKTGFDDVASVSDTMLQGIGNLLENVRDEIYVDTYISGRFKSRLTKNLNVEGAFPELTESNKDEPYMTNWRYVTQPVNGTETRVGVTDLRNRPKYQNKSAFNNGQMEYVIVGNQSEEWNKNQVYAYIYGIRLANNLYAVYTNQTVRETCRAAAVAVSSWWTMGAGVPIFHWAFMLAAASAETFIEMDYLVKQGYKIPLIKNKKNLNICPDGNTFQIGGGSVKAVPNFDEKDFGVCYEDFLHVFMFIFVDKETKLRRVADLIQMDYQAITGKSDFNLNKAYTYIRVDADASIDFKFIPAFDLSGIAEGYNGRMHNRNIIYHGY